MLSKYIIAVAALGLTTLASAKQQWKPCGVKLAPCTTDRRCVPDSEDCTNLDRCRGTCQFKNKYTPCGGKRVCEDANFECRRDPRPYKGPGLDWGICIPKKPPKCGGFSRIACPEGLFCYDLPCSIGEAGDCPGLCL